MRPLGNDTIQIKRAPLVVEPAGNEQYRDWANATLTTVSHCNLQPFLPSDRLQYEVNAEREFSRAVWRLYCPPGTDLLPSDRVIYAGEEYEVVSEAARWRRLGGQERYVGVILQRRIG